MTGFGIRKNVQSYGDIDYNFRVLEALLRGRVASGNILEQGIETVNIADLAVTTAKIDDLAVTTAKIEELAVTSAVIADLAVTTAKIADLAVTNAKIDDLEAGKITAGTITAAVEMTSATITGGLIRTNIDGNRMELTSDGLFGYTATGDLRFELSKGSLDIESAGIFMSELRFLHDGTVHGGLQFARISEGEVHVGVWAEQGDAYISAPDGDVWISAAEDGFVDIFSPVYIYDDLLVTGTLEAGSLKAEDGATGIFTCDGVTVTVADGIVISII